MSDERVAGTSARACTAADAQLHVLTLAASHGLQADEYSSDARDAAAGETAAAGGRRLQEERQVKIQGQIKEVERRRPGRERRGCRAGADQQGAPG